MGTMDQLEAKLRPYKFALIEAFGLDPEKTTSNISAQPDSVTFKVVGPLGKINRGPFAEANLRYECGSFTSAEFPSRRWTPEQRRAVDAYLDQFPSFGDFPGEIRNELRRSGVVGL